MMEIWIPTVTGCRRRLESIRLRVIIFMIKLRPLIVIVHGNWFIKWFIKLRFGSFFRHKWDMRDK
ncbi:MAG: hypothetical protein LBP59_17040 [Planctomycetaceae bacterium]|nr:hypothetical protein [Planctomycetaceae bacterium]